MELVLVLMMIAIVLGITRPFDQNNTIEEAWPESSFE